MEIVKWLLIALLGAVAAGSIAGVIWGRHQLKVSRGEARPILSKKQRIFCAGSLLLGLVCVLVAVLYNPAPAGDLEVWEEGGWDGEEEVFAVDEAMLSDDELDLALTDGFDGDALPDGDGEIDDALNPGAETDEAEGVDADDASDEQAAEDNVSTDSAAATARSGEAIAVPSMGGSSGSVAIPVG